MSDLREAAEMALKALNIQTPLNNREFELRNSALEALRQALAQPEQEPVAWMLGDNFYRAKQCNLFGQDRGKEKPNQIPLYTAPPKREWVRLSSLDKTLLRTAYAQLRPLYHDKKEDVSVAAEVVTDWDGFFAAIDAKLKEKNT